MNFYEFLFNVVTYFVSGPNWIVVVNIRIVVQLIGLNGDCVAGWPRIGPASSYPNHSRDNSMAFVSLKKGFPILHTFGILARAFSCKTVSISCYFQDYGLHCSND